MEVIRFLGQVHFEKSACAIGVFDGIHVGHRMVLENALRESRLLQVPSVVFSFSNHPQCLLSQTPPLLLSSLNDRLKAFENLGFDYAMIPEFTEELKSCSALQFVQSVLVNQLGAKSVTVGYDHRFGAGGQGDGQFLKQCGQHLGFDTQIIDPIRVDDQIVSSTLIRKLLNFGDIRQANRLLGHDYAVEGTVVQGIQRGRLLGFPTANLSIDTERLVPASGTYGGMACVNGKTYPAVCNIGLSPTFGDQTQKRVEVHLLGYQGPSFYDATLKMTFRHKLRDEQKFPSVDKLIAQIAQDCSMVERDWKTFVDKTMATF